MARSNRPAPESRIHAYAASFGADFARDSLSVFTQEGTTVLDPFVGAGTTALQSLLLNRNAIGIDVDPIASRISRVLTTRFDVDYLAAATESFERQLSAFETLLVANPEIYECLGPGDTFDIGSQSFLVPAEPAIAFWFDPSHMATLAIAQQLASQESNDLMRQFFEVAISSAIIRKWPNTLSYAMDIDHSRPHKPLAVKAQPVEKQFALLRRIIRQALRSVMNVQSILACVDAAATIYEGDSADKLSELDSESVDFVLTSPPYLNAIDYPRAHKFSQWWLFPGQPPLARSEYLGLRRGMASDSPALSSLTPAISELLGRFEDSKRYRELSRYVIDIASIAQQIYRVARPGASCVFVVADNVLEGKVLPVSEVIAELLSYSGLLDVTTRKRAIKKTRRRYPFGINGFTNTMKDEYVVTGHK